jgi:hypothetical protein
MMVKATGPAGPGEDDEPFEQETEVDPDSCQFQLDGLPPEGTLTVVATGRAWSERTLVTLPVSGDPAAVCFRPPCASTPASRRPRE